MRDILAARIELEIVRDELLILGEVGLAERVHDAIGKLYRNDQGPQFGFFGVPQKPRKSA
jgi:hypothetical protein